MEIKSTAGVVILLAFIFLFFYVSFFLVIRFPKWKYELQYINMELARTEGAERQLWKRRKRRLLLSLLPFVKIKID